MKKRSVPQSNSVFLNLPFERDYEPVFIGFIVGLVTLGLAPRSVLELDENGDGRMERLYSLMKQCGASIHDLSYQGTEFRYNMPFELGVAYALSRENPNLKLVVFESAKRNLLKTLTDLRHFDPKLHGRDGRKALSAVYDCFYNPSIQNPESTGLLIYKHVMKNIAEFRGSHTTIFNRRSFLILVHTVRAWTDLSTSR